MFMKIPEIRGDIYFYLLFIFTKIEIEMEKVVETVQMCSNEREIKR